MEQGLEYGTPPFPWRSESGPREAVIAGQAEGLDRCATSKSCWDRRLTGSSLRYCISARGPLCREYCGTLAGVGEHGGGLPQAPRVPMSRLAEMMTVRDSGRFPKRGCA